MRGRVVGWVVGGSMQPLSLALFDDRPIHAEARHA